jgi:uncharacterized protein with PQ loop repeat
MIPVWVGMVTAGVSGQIDVAEASGGHTVWLVIWPIVFVVGGLIGLVGLLRVLIFLSRRQRSSRGRRLTLAMVAIGLVDLLSFNLYGILLTGEFELPELDAALLVYWLLPLGGALHFLYLSRRGLLFGVEAKSPRDWRPS